MFETVLQTIQLMSLVVGITVGLLTISKHFRESGFFRNIIYIIAIVVPIVFLKIIIVFCSENFHLILNTFLGLGVMVSVLSLLVSKINYGLNLTELFQKKEYALPAFFCLSPVVSCILNIFKFNYPNGTDAYLLGLSAQKISLESYTYMHENFMLTGYFIGKCIELILILVFLIRGHHIFMLINNQENQYPFSPIADVTYYTYTSFQPNSRYVFGVFFTWSFFSANLFVLVLKLILSWF